MRDTPNVAKVFEFRDTKFSDKPGFGLETAEVVKHGNGPLSSTFHFGGLLFRLSLAARYLFKTNSQGSFTAKHLEAGNWWRLGSVESHPNPLRCRISEEVPGAVF